MYVDKSGLVKLDPQGRGWLSKKLVWTWTLPLNHQYCS